MTARFTTTSPRLPRPFDGNVQRFVQILPRRRLPPRLDGAQRAETSRKRLHRGFGYALVYAPVCQYADAARDSDGIGRLSEHQRIYFARRAAFGTAQQGVGTGQPNPGVSCVKPMGAMYMFPKIDTEMYRIHDDMKFVYDLLVREKVLLVQEQGLIGLNPTITALSRCLTSIRFKRRWAGWQDSCKPTANQGTVCLPRIKMPSETEIPVQTAFSTAGTNQANFSLSPSASTLISLSGA